MDRRPRPRRVGDRPDDRRVRGARAASSTRTFLPTAPVRLLRGDGPLIRVGHRGAAALAPENTLRSFEAALAHGVDAIEFDVLDLVGGPLVLAHSNDLARGQPRRGRRHRARPLARRAARGRARAADARRGARVPRRAAEVTVHVDLKLTSRLDELAEALARHGLGERTVVSSFHRASLRGGRARGAAAPDRLHLSGGPLRRLAQAGAPAGDPARHARAAARDRRRDPGADRARGRARR